MPFIRKSLKAPHFVLQFFVLISFFNIFSKNFFLLEAKTAITSEVLIFFSLSANYWFPVDNDRNFPPV